MRVPKIRIVNEMERTSYEQREASQIRVYMCY
jgi:hypothetical protein